jgi:16S rRNA (guanine(966)-N(2))-methyltransferase RsmD
MLKEALFSMLGPEVAAGPFLDLYAGTGAVAFEALSRGAPSATAVERHPTVLDCLRRTQADLDARAFHLEACEALAFLAKSAGAGFAVAFADPPFGDIPDDLLERLLPVVRPGGLAVLQLPREHLARWSDREGIKVRRYGTSLLIVVRKDANS